MSSKTFKSAKSNLELGVVRSNEGYLRIWVGEPDHKTFGLIDLAPSDAPALALAVLEAAYGRDHPVPHKIREAWTSLYVHIIEEERATAEAKEQAELEAEALELYNVCMTGHNLTSFDGLGGALRDQWLAVARRAREMRAEK